MSASPHRSGLLLWAGSAFLILASIGAFIASPLRACPDCEGGIELVAAPGSQREACRRCVGQGRLSRLRKWTAKPKMTYVGAVNMLEFSKFIRPLLDREKIEIVGGDSSLGIIGFYAASPPEAVRARKLIEADARAKGYTFR